MSINLSIGALFANVFGYNSKAFEPEFNKIVSSNKDSVSRKEFGKYGAEYYKEDLLGREYFLPVTVQYLDGGTLKTWDLPYPVISINERKTIIETALTERRGTVKQLINLGDYEINIKGFIISKNNEMPEDDIITLRIINEVRASISITNALTDIFLMRPDRKGKDDVVITSMKLLDITGVKNVRPYELTMLSDEPFDLIAIK